MNADDQMALPAWNSRRRFRLRFGFRDGEPQFDTRFHVGLLGAAPNAFGGRNHDFTVSGYGGRKPKGIKGAPVRQRCLVKKWVGRHDNAFNRAQNSMQSTEAFLP